jgi:PAS domain-containing protein
MGEGAGILVIEAPAYSGEPLAIQLEINEGLGGGRMAHPIQIILMRQLAGYLSVPLFLVDPQGSLLFYNEPAETLLGRRFEETGAMPAEEWSSVFTPVDDGGQPIPPNDLPLMITLTKRRPAFRRFFIRSLDGVLRRLEVASIPITGLQGDFLGAAALFWELSE